MVDFADGAKNDDWHDYAAYASAAYARYIPEITYHRPVAFAQITRMRGDDQP